MAQSVAGTMYLLIDGQQQSLRGSVKVQPGLFKRTEIVNIDGKVNWKEEPVAGSIMADLTIDDSFSAAAINGVAGATITIELANGRTYLLEDGFQVGDLEIDADEGKCSVKFCGNIEEI